MKFNKDSWRETFSLADAHYRDAKGLPVPGRDEQPEEVRVTTDYQHIEKAIWHLQKYLENLR